MSQSRNRQLAIDLIPSVLLIGYGIVEPMMSILAVPVESYYDPWAEIGFERGTWRLAGATIGSGQMCGAEGWRKAYVLIVPYWSLVLPLTLLSAWLILAKPRKAKAATVSGQPIP